VGRVVRRIHGEPQPQRRHVGHRGKSSADLGEATVGNGGAGVVVIEGNAHASFWSGGAFRGNRPTDACGGANFRFCGTAGNRAHSHQPERVDGGYSGWRCCARGQAHVRVETPLSSGGNNVSCAGDSESLRFTSNPWCREIPGLLESTVVRGAGVERGANWSGRLTCRRLGRLAFYMTGGTVMPITARARISSRRTTATVESRNNFRFSSGSVKMGYRW
jgi:hypothetical protein